jgi:hypothetical protein
LRDVLTGVDSYTMIYTNHRGQTVAEVTFPDEQGLVRRAYIHHM